MVENTDPLYDFEVRREKWRGKDDKYHYHSVARNAKGHILSHRSWKGKQTTEDTKNTATFNVSKRRESVRRFKPEETVYAPSRRTDVVTRQSQGDIHKQYAITCEIRTEFGNKWYIIIESDKNYLSANDILYIKRALLRTYTPKKRDVVYTEQVTDVKPVLCRNLANGSKVVY